MVLDGLPSTIMVTLEMMILHGRAVMRGSLQALVVIDLPFGTYERSPEQAYTAAVRLMQEAGCQAVKVQAGGGVAERVAFLVARGISVVGYVGLRPQATNVEGGFKVKGRTGPDHERVLMEAHEIEAAGAFAIVIEGVAAPLADAITAAAKVPTICIGALGSCDGQILVTEDMLGLFGWTPKCVRRYAGLLATINDALERFAADVRNRRFPAEAETCKTRSS